MKNALIIQHCKGEIVSIGIQKQKYMLYFDKWSILSGFYQKFSSVFENPHPTSFHAIFKRNLYSKFIETKSSEILKSAFLQIVYFIVVVIIGRIKMGVIKWSIYKRKAVDFSITI